MRLTDARIQNAVSVALSMFVCASCQSTPPSTLACVIEHGDKPATVFIVTVKARKVSDVSFFVTSPDTPSDTATGQPYPIRIDTSNAQQFTATIHLPKGQRDQVTFTFIDPIGGSAKSVRATLSDATGIPEDVVFERR